MKKKQHPAQILYPVISPTEWKAIDKARLKEQPKVKKKKPKKKKIKTDAQEQS